MDRARWISHEPNIEIYLPKEYTLVEMKTHQIFFPRAWLCESRDFWQKHLGYILCISVIPMSNKVAAGGVKHQKDATFRPFKKESNALYFLKGSDITKGLKKVSDDQKTHKNPTLRGSSLVPSKVGVYIWWSWVARDGCWNWRIKSEDVGETIKRRKESRKLHHKHGEAA